MDAVGAVIEFVAELQHHAAIEIEAARPNRFDLGSALSCIEEVQAPDCRADPYVAHIGTAKRAFAVIDEPSRADIEIFVRVHLGASIPWDRPGA